MPSSVPALLIYQQKVKWDSDYLAKEMSFQDKRGRYMCLDAYVCIVLCRSISLISINQFQEPSMPRTHSVP